MHSTRSVYRPTHSVTTQMAARRRNPQLKGPSFDKMLPGHGYVTPPGEVIYDFGAMMEWWLA
jgi:hypothetical protein